MNNRDIKFRKKILIADDVEINRQILSELFADEYDALFAANGLEAVDVMAKHKDEIAAVLLDVVMPVMDGFGTLNEMKSRGLLGYAPIIALTADRDDGRDVNIIDLGAEDIIVKPFVSNIIRRRVTNAVYAWEYKKEHNL